MAFSIKFVRNLFGFKLIVWRGVAIRRTFSFSNNRDHTKRLDKITFVSVATS
ncbi:hypothetical protein FD41_GL000269 [Lentilactobacillus farraginis DSM 18382 = JCM 14108]|uniref:Uncharacterized protein n=1 Tax=Lentilactobacillus farraginis DSM 18382 = JCM 14108 TaxID=1423743 RepID=A0A0R1VRV6_9LACO|nr:hypothetical protein FD41_GL000269 [Lentilactobacillus farraginis DSM 18382 = JCM 14108]